MPTFKITGPDGRSYRITGDTAEGAMAALQQHLGTAPAPKQDDSRSGFMGSVDSFVRGAADTMSLGLADEIAAGGDALFNPIFGTGQDGGSLSERYNANLKAQRGVDEADSRDRAASRFLGQLTGGVTGGVGLARNGLSMGANAAARGASLGRVAGATAADGAILGAAQGAGSGEGVDGRLAGAATGAFVGGGLGAATPFAVAGAQKALSPVVAPIGARLFPESYANRAIGEGLKRSGQSVDEIVKQLDAARFDGQDMFNVADAMGNSGQRMLSTAARTPHDERQMVIEGLQRRQVGQGDRLSSFLAEGFGAPDTAAQREAALTAQRAATASTNYGAARQGAGNVDPSKAIAAADQFLGTNGSLPRTNIADDSIEGAVNRARSYLTDGQSMVSDFDTAFRAKQEIDALIERGSPSAQRVLIPIRNELDNALEAASPQYANARNVFRQQSKAIEAVDEGKNAASGRRRSADTIPQFSAMQPDQQAAFRAGYVDPLIARVESTSMSPTTNKARPLITPKTGEEFPAFAVPGRADQLGNRIAREQRMFETANAALGGSKTADNLADAAEMSKFDPGVMSALMRFDVPGALMSGARNVMNEASGTPPRVVEQIAKALMETNPTLAREVLTGGKKKLSQSDALRARIVAALTGATSAAPGRLVSP